MNATLVLWPRSELKAFAFLKKTVLGTHVLAYHTREGSLKIDPKTTCHTNRSLNCQQAIL